MDESIHPSFIGTQATVHVTGVDRFEPEVRPCAGGNVFVRLARHGQTEVCMYGTPSGVARLLNRALTAVEQHEAVPA